MAAIGCEPGEKVRRLLDLLKFMPAEGGTTTAYLAEQMGITTRSVQRYIATLRDAGFDIEFTRSYFEGRGSQVFWRYRSCPFCGHRRAT